MKGAIEVDPEEVGGSVGGEAVLEDELEEFLGDGYDRVQGRPQLVGDRCEEVGPQQLPLLLHLLQRADVRAYCNKLGSLIKKRRLNLNISFCRALSFEY